MGRKVLLGRKTEQLMYGPLRVFAWLRLIPFYVVADPHGTQKTGQNSSAQDHKMSDNRKLIRFAKSSKDIWLYYIMTTFYFGINAFKILLFLSPLLGEGIQMDIHFGADIFFVSAIFFSGVFKITILFCVGDLIFLINEVDQWIHDIQQFTKTKKELGDNENTGSVEERRTTDFDEKTEEIWTKYTWYCTTEGILTVWSTMFTGHAVWFVLTVMGIYKSEERQLGAMWMVLESVLATFVAFVDCFLSITSVYLTVAIIVQLKLNLTLFEEICHLQKRATKMGSVLSHLIKRYKSLVVFCTYADGYYRVLFPGYIGVVQFIVLAVLYVALTAHRYLPFFIYWVYPATSIFLFCVLVLLVLSQVGNIFRQSGMVCQRLKRQLVREFSTPSRGKPLSSNRQLILVESLETNPVEREYLQKKMLTIRPFGFYSGFYGAIDQNTPASMTANICNCMILLLSFG